VILLGLWCFFYIWLGLVQVGQAGKPASHERKPDPWDGFAIRGIFRCFSLGKRNPVFPTIGKTGFGFELAGV
jgi:hypothetical protein